LEIVAWPCMQVNEEASYLCSVRPTAAQAHQLGRECARQHEQLPRCCVSLRCLRHMNEQDDVWTGLIWFGATVSPGPAGLV